MTPHPTTIPAESGELLALREMTSRWQQRTDHTICGAPAVGWLHWPGHDARPICEAHAAWAESVGRAMGFHARVVHDAIQGGIGDNTAPRDRTDARAATTRLYRLITGVDLDVHAFYSRRNTAARAGLSTDASWTDIVDAAEARGFARGVEAAAKVAEDYDGDGLNHRQYTHRGDASLTMRDITKRIRALLPTPTPETTK
jgi:hypothetical protein